MNLRDLHYIAAVAEHGHFGKAAAACNVSQPTLSGQILKLEEELGVRIFERSGRSVRITMVGEQILDRARQALAATREIGEIARASRDPLAGSLRIGVIPTIAPYLMPFVLPLAAEVLPAAPLMLYEDLTGHLLQAFSDGELDAAILASDPEDTRLEDLLLFNEPFWLVMPPDHPLAAKERVRAEDIDPGSVLLLADGHCLRDQAVDFCRQQARGTRVGTDIRAASLETLLHLTAAHYGLTLVPRLAVGNDLGMIGRLVARPLDGPNNARRIRLVCRAGTPRRQAIGLLADMIRKSLPDSVERISPA